MQELVEYIVKSLVTNPEAVIVSERSEEGNIQLSLRVDPQDMGLVIGKGGQMIKAIRKLLTVRAMADNVRVSLYLEEATPAETDSAPEVKPA